jgi:hypothetical protein
MLPDGSGVCATIPFVMTHELSRNQSHEVAMSLIYAALTYTALKEPVDVEALVEDYFGVRYDEADLFVKTILILEMINRPGCRLHRQKLLSYHFGM